MSRKTTPPPVTTTATTPLAALAELCGRYEIAATQLAATEAERDREVALVDAKYSDRRLIEELAVEELKKEITSHAKKNRNLFPEGQRSREFGAVEVGFRISPPAVDLPKKLDEEEVALRIAEDTELGARYVRSRIGLRRDVILAERDSANVVDRLAGLGVRIVQKNTFFIAGPQIKKPGE
jgi:phage host-nuclease inhibitor protein Gam